MESSNYADDGKVECEVLRFLTLIALFLLDSDGSTYIRVMDGVLALAHLDGGQ